MPSIHADEFQRKLSEADYIVGQCAPFYASLGKAAALGADVLSFETEPALADVKLAKAERASLVPGLLLRRRSHP